MKIKHIAIKICEACLDGVGDECHTPGCALWLHSVDLPIDENLYIVLDECEYALAENGKMMTKKCV
jgi:hypothetical protein